MDGIVVQDPHPQYSALDRMDGLDDARLKGSRKPFGQGQASQAGSDEGCCGGDPSTEVGPN
jgi:hypothetical protein